MKPQWHFNARRACDRMRDSANDAFFTAESLENLSEALVREGIQNSLDAAQRSNGNVRQVCVRISIIPRATAEVRGYLADLFGSARQNFERGLSRPNLDSLFGDDCGYLVFEDFGTRGLTGDIEEWRLEKAEQNAFFSFFRAEGRSPKSGESLGRWGIGKQVFPTASRLHAMIGLTIREDSPVRVFMGSAVVRNHSVSGQDFQGDAWFGCRDVPGKPDFVFQKIKLAIFVDGCFWHGCPKHATWPASRAAWWRKKIVGNRARDALVSRTLRRAGWRVLRVWEHELARKNEVRLMRRLSAAISG